MLVDLIIEAIMEGEDVDLDTIALLQESDGASLTDKDLDLALKKGYIHDRAGKKHELTAKQRRFFYYLKGKHNKEE